MEAVGKEQVLGVVTRVDAVEFEATDDIRPGPGDLGEKLVDIDEDDPLAVVSDKVPEAVVEACDRAAVGVGQRPGDQARIEGPAKNGGSTEDRRRYRPRS